MFQRAARLRAESGEFGHHQQVKSLESPQLEHDGQQVFEEFRFECSWEKYYDMHQHEKATQTTQYYDLAADEDPGLIEAMSLSFQMRMGTMSLESEWLASAANHAWFSTLSAMERLPGMFVRAPGILYTRSETDFVCIGMETEWQRLRAGLDELLRGTAMGEHAYWTSHGVAGGSYEIGYGDCVRHEYSAIGSDGIARSRVRYGTVLGSPEGPDYYMVEFGHGNLATVAAQELSLQEPAQWPS